MESQAREFHWERSQSFARSSRGQQGGKESIKEVLENSILERGKKGLQSLTACQRYGHSI